MLHEVFRRMKAGTEFLNYGRPIIENWGASLVAQAQPRERREGPFRVLDLGCGHGTDLVNVRGEALRRVPAADMELHGIENYPPYIAECRQAGIKIHPLDIERDRFPLKEASFDLVMANQVLEHTKEIFWIFAEVARVLRPGGSFIVGVPNLASLHNRLLLLFGGHPTAQVSLSAHVRSFTKPDMLRFATKGDFFRPAGFRGSNFYPFPPVLSRPLARILPNFAWGIFFLLQRTERQGSFLECLAEGDQNVLETPYYGSPQNPAAAKRSTRTPSGGRGGATEKSKGKRK